MELSNPMGQRTRIVAQVIAIAFLAMGVLILYPIMKWPFSWDFGSIVFGLVFGAILFGLAYLCFKVAMDFWKGPTIYGANSLSILIGCFVGLYIFSIIPYSWIRKSADESFHFPWLQVFFLLEAIAAGIIYEKTKKYSITYFHLSQAESAQTIISRRKRYFIFAGFFLWSFFMQIGMWFDDRYGILRLSDTSHVPEWLKIIFPFVVLIIPIVLARMVYKRCVKKFLHYSRRET